MSGHDRNKWYPRVLIGALAASALLAMSGFVPGPWRTAWDGLDAAVFFALNGMLEENPAMAVFWALANHRAFALVSVLIFLALFWRFVVHGGAQERVLERLAGCGLFVVYAAFAALVVGGVALDVARESPSLALEPVHRISEIVPWMDVHDASEQSFPSRRGTLAIVFALCLVHAYGRRAVWWGGALVLALLLPRIVGGAHWLSDVALGSVLAAVPVLALAFATPLHSRLADGIARGLRRWLPIADPFARDLFSPATPPLIGKGICMGTADIIPGVSGGTMAYILGIYERLLASITVFRPEWFRKLTRFEIRSAVADVPVLFLAPLGFGIVLAMWIFTRMIPLPHFVQYHPEPVYGLFFGLVGGSVVLLLRKHARPRVMDGVTIAAGIALGIAIVSLVPADTPDSAWFIFLAGMLAISAMLLPGISGSFILLILGKYALILGAIGDLDLRVLLPFAFGCGFGLLAFAHSLKWLLSRYSHTVHLIITGLLIGTLRAVWPFQERVYAEVREKERLVSSDPFWPEWGAWLSLAGILMVAGFAIIYALDRLSRAKPEP